MAGCPHTQEEERYERIAEGMCPRCPSRLEVNGDHGDCLCCGFGWAITPDRVSLRIKAMVPPELGGSLE